MLNVTPAALEFLSRRLNASRRDDQVAMRFDCSGKRWQLRPDRVRPGDASYSHGGRKVLLLDQGAVTAMSALTLDVRQGGEGPRLSLFKSTPRKARRNGTPPA